MSGNEVETGSDDHIPNKDHPKTIRQILEEAAPAAFQTTNSMIRQTPSDSLGKLGQEAWKASAMVQNMAQQGIMKLRDYPKSDSGTFADSVSRYTEPFHMPVIRFPWHQLLIIGNGFDLECGLKSQFSDFATERTKLIRPVISREMKPPKEFWGKLARDAGLTVWDVILLPNSDSEWNGIETAIERWVDPKTTEDDYLSDIEKDLSQCIDGSSSEIRNSLLSPNFIASATEQMRVAQYIAHVEGNDLFQDRKPLRRFLLQELHRYEQAFADYLSHQVEHEVDYHDHAYKLYRTLSFDEFPGNDHFDCETSVLSFNYTNPFHIPRNGDDKLHWTNIHGTLGKEIVFGIDGTSRLNKPDVVPFTKTYRLLALDNPDAGTVIRTRAQSSVPDGSTDLIKFYGHSLQEADYSYFQSIFDGVSLYDSHTRLIFYYKPWKLSDGTFCPEQDAQQAMFRKVTKLMNKYSKTMVENPEHGKNLMHKLLLEGRLSIKRFHYNDEGKAKN